MIEKNKVDPGYIEGGVSIIINTVLFVLKFWAGVVTGSIALVADAWHTLSDSISSVIVVVAVKLSSRKPDKEHPFGHGRWEQIAALFIGFLLAIIAFDFLKTSITRFSAHESTTFGTLAVVVTIISIVLKEGLAQYAFYVGKKANNISIKADGWHHRTDALSSVVVLVGICISKYFWWIDSVLGIIIALMLFYATYKIIKESVVKILGEEPSSEMIDNIAAVCKDVYPGELNLHHFHLHNYVTHQELTFHIKLNKDMTIEEGHNIATRIEREVLEKYNISATIHVEPIE